MADALRKAKNKASSVTITTSSVTEERNKKVPAGAEIVKETVTTSTEKIENGWLIIKSYDVNYKAKGKDYTDYAYYSKKWYSKTDPLEVKLKQEALADAFDDVETP
jgi:hypothetical protein